MPINYDKQTLVELNCSKCDGDGATDIYTEKELECESCKGTGKVTITVAEFIENNISKEISQIPLTYTFDDMIKAFELGVLAECGHLPSKDYMITETIIRKYFTPIDTLSD